MSVLALSMSAITVTIKLADQSIPACKAIKTKS
ncbi:hypothetical protein ACBK50_2940 [Acinetobacter baumannii]|nr:hypothetical protein ACBK50_2940 [Acinetobacter baumannii]